MLRLKERNQKINSAHYLELMDRIHVAMSMIYDHVAIHIIAESNGKLSNLIDDSVKNLLEAYQLTEKLSRDFDEQINKAEYDN
jgi:hypothetical protein